MTTSPPRRRLARRYVAIAVALVAGAVLATGALNLRLSYLDARDALAEVQGEQATGAAGRISAFVDAVDRQLEGATVAGSAEGQRDEFRRILFQLPAVTDVRAIDETGRERVVVSRVEPDVVGEGADRSADAIFTEPAPGRPYYAPVEFRDGTEPHLHLAHRTDDSGVVVADIHLSLISEVVAAVDVRHGEAFAVDRDGVLVAHRDLTLLLDRRDLSSLSHVRRAMTASSGDGLVGRNADGDRVLASYRTVEPLGWAVFVEQPLSIVFDRVEDAVVRTAVLLLVGVAVAGIAALVLARRLVRPLAVLQDGATRIGAGDLDHRIDLRSGDELEALADQFNRMSAQLGETLEELRESRARIVAAADDARRRLERDLHDGAQQHLIAVALKARLARRAVDDAAPVAAILDEVHEDVQSAVTELRNLAHGIFPPLLASGGLAAALPAAAKLAAIPATVELDGVDRYPQDVEATAYFCCVEALQNAAKHAGDGAAVHVTVRADGERLTFIVRDDGVGFDPAAVGESHGFVNMADRLRALDGTFDAVSAPGEGTCVTGSIPLR